MPVLSAFLVGTLFGMGLAISEMINPERVIGFLDITGTWDPTLAFVMGGALAVALPGFSLVLRRREPFMERRFHLPTRTEIDAPLLLGAGIFGVGWGLAGLCPGPALAGLMAGKFGVLLFVVAMAAGLWLAPRFARSS